MASFRPVLGSIAADLPPAGSTWLDYPRSHSDRKVMRTPHRHPMAATLLLALAGGLGVASRHFAGHLPYVLAAFAGDTLWAFALFLFLGLVLPRVATARVAAAAFGLSMLVEISQLYHAPWIDAIRQTTLGGLVLGFGFLWSDLVCYAVGGALGAAIEWGLSKA
jgi:Protein of unknown function (DUF2809)